MIEYIVGKISQKDLKQITLEFKGIGVNIYINKINSFEIGKEYKIYCYLKIYEDEISIYGFTTLKEKRVFLKLLDLQGIGPKTALSILKNVYFENLISYIKNKNLNELTKISGIGSKASYFINELYKKFDCFKLENIRYDATFKALRSLGYSESLILDAINKLEDNLNEQFAFKTALRIIKNNE